MNCFILKECFNLAALGVTTRTLNMFIGNKRLIQEFMLSFFIYLISNILLNKQIGQEFPELNKYLNKKVNKFI